VSEDASAPERRSRMFRRADASNVPLRTILVSVGVVGMAYLGALVLYRLRVLLLLLLVGGFVAVLLNPVVTWFEEHGVRRRGAAVGIVSVLGVIVFVGLAILFGYPLVNGLTHLSTSLPGYVRSAETGRGWLGHLLSRYHVATWVQHNSAKLISLAQGLSKPALALGRGAFSMLIALLTIFTFVVLVLMEAPRMKNGLMSLTTPERARRIADIGNQVSRAVTGYMLGNLTTSIIAGAVVFVSLALMGVPFAPLFALWVALVDFLPTIGGALAGIPTVLFAFTHSIAAGVVTAVVFLAYTQLENHVLNPVVMSRTARINALSVFVAVLIGAEVGAWVGGIFGGFVGVLLAVPGAATTQVLGREVWALVRPGSAAPTDLDTSEGER
jgi:predicted PurR-regulated permease PerM